MKMKVREAAVRRQTAETQVRLKVNIDGTGMSSISTGVGFLDHMLTIFAKHSVIDLEVEVTGDLDVDSHHTVEDTGLLLGTAVREAIGDRAGIRRYGFFMVPMDESLASVAVDFSGRPCYVAKFTFPTQKIGTFDSELIREFWQAFANTAMINLHQLVHYGQNSHHIAEAIFKATARAVRMASEYDPRVVGIPSTKGSLD